MSGGVSKGYSSSRSEVFEYHPEPWNQWINKGKLETSRGFHAVLSIGTEHLPCLSGCPPLPPSPGHLCVAPAGAKDCHYAADHCCCGHCSESFTFSCARPDSTTETGFWKSTLCPEEGCGSEGEWWREFFFVASSWKQIYTHTGVVTSPNYPGDYPNNLKKTQTIQVESGKVVRLDFTHFAVYSDPSEQLVAGQSSECQIWDHVKITDGDGTALMDMSCGSSLEDPHSPRYFLPPTMTTRSNTVEIFFRTYDIDNVDFGKDSGWSLSWSAVTPG